MAYIGKSPTGTGVRSRFHFTATGSETSLSGADDNGKTLVFADGEYVDVYVNGVLLFDGDYNTTTANTIGGLAALAANDVVEIVVYDIFSVADTVSAKNGGTFSSDVAVNGDISATDGTFSGDIKIGNDTDRTSYLTETNANLQIGGGVIFEAGSGNNAEILNYRTTSMVFGNGGSEDMRLDGSGNLGIGDAPDKTLHVSKANSEFRIDNAGAEEYTVSTGAVDGAIFHTYYDRGGSTYIDSISRATTHQWRGSDGNEDMRIDSGGRLLINTTNTNPADSNVSGTRLGGQAEFSVSGGPSAEFNRIGADGDLIRLKKDGTTYGTIGSEASDLVIDGITNHSGFRFLGASVRPRYSRASSDNQVDMGASSGRFDDIYATNGTIQTSDENEKQQIASLTSAEITAAKAISKMFKTFKWNDSVSENGDNARIHTGVIAQQVETAMTDAGLDAGDYAFFISTDWYVDADGEEVEADAVGAVAKNRKGIRYPELLAFVGAATEQRLADIETRLTTLENA